MSPSNTKMTIQNTKKQLRNVCLLVLETYCAVINCLDVFNLQSSGKDWSLGVNKYGFCSLYELAVGMVLVYCLYGPMLLDTKCYY